MTHDDDATQVILAELRRGASVSIGGSRAHTSYGYRDGRWVADVYDESHAAEHPCDEATIRRVIHERPDDFVHLLRAPHVRSFRAAFTADDRPAARAALRAASACGDPQAQMASWDAALAPEDESPPAATRAAIIEHLRGHTAWHAFWDLVGWDRTPALAARGVWFVDRLIALAGIDPPPAAALAQRESFVKLADPAPE